MHGAHRARSLADRGGDPLDRAVAHVADGEHAGHRRLERQRVARPANVASPRTVSGSERSVRTKPLASSATASSSQAVAGSAPMKQKSPEHSTVAALAGGRVLERHVSRCSSPASARTSVVAEQLDPRVGVDPLDEVVRHAVREVGAADRDRHAAALLREVDRGLAGGVAATDDDHRLAAARCALRDRSPRSTRRRPRTARDRRPRAVGSARPTR